MSQKQIQIPKGWKLEKLSNLCVKITDGAHKSPKNNEQGDFYYITAKNIKPGKINLATATFISKKDHLEINLRCNPEKGDILFTKDGSFGHAVVNELDFPFSLLSSVALLKPDFSKINSYYLEYFLNSGNAINQIKSKISGGGLKRIVLKDIKNIECPLPPLPIQKKIVKKLDYILNQIDPKKKQILELQENNEERIRLMRLEANRAILQYFIPIEIPANWHTKKLSELAKIGQGGTPLRANPSYWNGNIPWLSSGEVLDNIILNSREQITENGFRSKFTKKFPKGTILLAMTGQGKTRGRTALLEIEATTNQSCAHIINTSNEILTEFLWEFLKSRYWFIRSIQYGGGQPGINTTMIKELDISYPSKPEQEQILKKIANMGRMIPDWKKQFEEVSEQIDSNIKHLEYIPTQIRDKAFSGKLTN